VADLLGQAMNGEQKICASVDALKNQFLVDFPLRETGKSKGDFAICGWRLRALP